MITTLNLLKASNFEPEFKFYNGAWGGHLPFAYWLMPILKPKVFVELGTHVGNSYFTICQSVRDHNLPTKCFAIDSFEGDIHMGRHKQSIYDNVCERNNRLYKPFSTILRCYFDDALQNFPDGSIDLLHIDGLHTYEAVRHDFETWLPKLSPNAIVLFHDTMVVNETFGVIRYWNELIKIYPNNLNFLHSNGLGVLKPHSQPSPIDELFREPVKGQAISYFSDLGSLIQLKSNHALIMKDYGFLTRFLFRRRASSVTAPIRAFCSFMERFRRKKHREQAERVKV